MSYKNQLLDKIYIQLQRNKNLITAPGLLTGMSGVAIFCQKYEQLNSLPKTNSLSDFFNDKIVESINEIETSDFCEGLIGVAWYLKKYGKDIIDEADYFEFENQIKELVFENFIEEVNENNFDFLYGMNGSLLYLAETGAINEPRFSLVLEEAIHQLLNNLKQGEWGKYFEYPIDENGGDVNCGLSHGLPAFISVFSLLIAKLDKPIEGLEKQLDEIISYLLGISNQEGSSLFPHHFLQGSPPVPFSSRLAWCYGDPGIAGSLLLSSQLTGKPEIRAHAIRIAEHTAKRTNLEENRVNDAGICHGTAGLALIFLRFFQTSRRPDLKKAAEYWLQKTIGFLEQDSQLQTFQSWNGKETIPDFSLLTGISGIGLVLFEFLDSEAEKSASDWDRCLLIN